ncbi:DUF2971 domain-containing protein [Aeromonas veronii]|uniref:DUF2971 domain-containing protein n=1 Tax=Aeromonas veronii TaxID=654 RepID=UPI002B491951|nr:DUF2971 domain-containing protein [Aeromonas veronii]
MEILYKYTNFFGVHALTNPQLRLSIPSTLNDPFEGIFNEKLENEMFDKFDLETLKIYISENSNAKTKDAIKRMTIKDIINIYGIIAMSETPRNLLMWAHYANEHKGICIGYKADLFDDLAHCPESRLNLESKRPKKVNYDNIRPHETKSKCNDINELIKELENHFTTKSDEWIYEKEHRYIIPLRWATKLKAINKDDEILMETIDLLTKNNMLTKTKNVTSDEYQINNFTQVHEFAEKYENVAYLIDVNPSKIVSIHFGCKFEKEQIKKIKSVLHSQYWNLSHIKLYHLTPSRSRFELIANEI